MNSEVFMHLFPISRYQYKGLIKELYVQLVHLIEIYVLSDLLLIRQRCPRHRPLWTGVRFAPIRRHITSLINLMAGRPMRPRDHAGRRPHAVVVWTRRSVTYSTRSKHAPMNREMNRVDACPPLGVFPSPFTFGRSVVMWWRCIDRKRARLMMKCVRRNEALNY